MAVKKAAAPAAATSGASPTLPSVFTMETQTGMLEALGINMYTSLGKCLVEFAANAYDSDAEWIKISVPFADVAKARAELRKAAKEEVKKGKRDRFSALQDPLPDGLTIVIEDNGHGMAAEDVQKKFLKINRNRREDATGAMSESGKRHVMGRKGLGKLAGFGTAEKITVRTKRAGETYATTFVMDYREIKKYESLSQVKLTPSYEHKLPLAEKGTRITLDRLRCDALKADEGAISEVLADAFFGIDEAVFRMELNGQTIRAPEVQYEFEWPAAADRDADGFGNHKVVLEDFGDYEIRYVVRFRAREGDPAADGTTKKRGSLPATRRGARIYCNKRLVAGPSLLRLKTGMHNFHSQSYMEAVVHADELDRHKIDFISTNRSDLRSDNEVVDRLIDDVTNLMAQALYQHGIFRDSKVTKDIETDAVGGQLLRQIGGLSKKSQAPARRILKVLAAPEGVQGQMFRDVAPLVLESMNAGEVLVRLIELGSDPKSMITIVEELSKLGDVERRDLLKVYRGRRSGITALTKLMEKADDTMRSGPKFEKDLHSLLKEHPWLIRPEYSRYLTSDKPLGDVAKKLTKALKIDREAIDSNGEPKDPARRPDLVFVAVESASPSFVFVVELKSPNIPLNTEHLTQLEDYMLMVRDVMKSDHSRDVIVQGHLIGNVPSQSQANKPAERVLLDRISKRGPGESWEVLTLPQILERTRKVHLDYIEALEAMDDEEQDPAPAPVARVS